MTNEELQKIVQAFQPLFRFLAKTHQDEAWHDTRRQFLAHADQQIVALVEEPVAEPIEAPPSEEANKPESKSGAVAPHGKNSNPRQTKRGKRRESPSPYDASLGRLPPKPKDA